MAEANRYEVKVAVQTRYVEYQSDPEEARFIFSYTVTITNTGTVPAQLISRHWIILDSAETEQQIRGLGVIGQQPLLKAGEKFEYTSGCALNTPVGTMRGSYQMVAEDGTQFEAEIPEFTLAMPRILH